MKRLFLLLVVMTGLFTALPTQQIKAQAGSAYTFPVIAGDSLVNADTVFKKITVTASYDHLAIQVSLKKGTGTLDGKFYLYKSVNAGSYVLSDSASFSAVTTSSLSGAVSNGGYTYTAIIEKVTPGGTRYLVAATQAGTLTATPVLVSYTLRKNP